MSKNAMHVDLSRQMKKNKSTSTHPASRQIWDTLLKTQMFFAKQIKSLLCFAIRLAIVITSVCTVMQIIARL
jgi:hypothetical protein